MGYFRWWEQCFRKDKDVAGVCKWVINSGSSRRRGGVSTAMRQETLTAEDSPGHSSKPCSLAWPTQRSCEVHALTALRSTGKAEVQRGSTQPARGCRAPGSWGEAAQGQRRFLTPLRSQGGRRHPRQVPLGSQGPSAHLSCAGSHHVARFAPKHAELLSRPQPRLHPPTFRVAGSGHSEGLTAPRAHVPSHLPLLPAQFPLPAACSSTSPAVQRPLLPRSRLHVTSPEKPS